MTSVLDMCRMLGIADPLAHSTCIGYGQRKPTCGNPRAEQDRRIAVIRIAYLAKDWDRGVDVEAQLEEIAHLLLCKGNHAALQSKEKAREWQRKLRSCSRQPRPTSAPVGTSTASRGGASSSSNKSSSKSPKSKPPPTKEHVIQSLTDDELIEELRRRLFASDSATLVDSVLDVADDIEYGHFDLDVEPPPVPTVFPHPSRNDNSISYPPRTTSRPRSTSSSSSSLSPSTGTSFGSLSSASNLCTACLAALSPPPPPASPLRQTHVECIVCMEPYGEADSTHWQCDKCLNRTHQSCFEGWCAAKIEHEVVTCPCCRAEVI